MERRIGKTRRFGLIGKNISYSFSKAFFNEKFAREKIVDCSYENFDFASLTELKRFFEKPNTLTGLNVTIPYKEQIIPLLDDLDSKAHKVGAVNTIKFSNSNRMIGYNTDVDGFRAALLPLLKKEHKKALILGTGGASKAIAFVLNELDIDSTFVSRKKKEGRLNYRVLNREIIVQHQIIINCTPLGTFPQIKAYPQLPYHYLSNKHLLFDLTYTPAETQFMKLGKQQGAEVCNGLEMLKAQAEKAWNIWNT